jgi:seryl-tRNA synthetase
MDANLSAGSAERLAAIPESLLHRIEVDGVYARTAAYEEVIERLAAFISKQREPGTEVLRFPPVMSRRQLERSGYLKSFPNLLGCVSALHGTEAEIRAAADRHQSGGDWTSGLAAADLVLAPAACYPVYPMAAARGPLPSGGLRFDVACDCFRHEPSKELDRMQSFRMREYVYMGAPRDVVAFRDHWMKRGQDFAQQLGLPYTIAPASDPFFGRTGQVMAISQLQNALKFELLVPVRSTDRPTACMSFNYHQDHFGTTWGLRDASGELAHTACAAFGMDRLAVALFVTHGLDPRRWPSAIRSMLGLS